MSRRPATVSVVVVERGGDGERGRSFPKILVSEIDPDPETMDRVEFSREEPPVLQRARDVDRNIWWINSAAPLARTYLDRDRGYGYDTREWRIYHLERIIEVMARIAIAYATEQGEEMTMDSWVTRWGDVASDMQLHAANTLGDYIDNGVLPTDGGTHG